jgi:hypothetical protein
MHLKHIIYVSFLNQTANQDINETIKNNLIIYTKEKRLFIMQVSHPLTSNDRTSSTATNHINHPRTSTQIQWELLNAEGGYWSAEQVLEFLGISACQRLDEMREQSRLLGVWWEDRYVYPAWQFAESGKLLNGLPQVLRTLSSFSAWEKLSYILSSNCYLDNQNSPLVELQRGNMEDVILAATE